jgi:hypothetical protein
MKFDPIEICNYALVILSQSEFINSLEGELLKPYEVIISKVYKNVFDTCLSDLMPNFAIKEYNVTPDISGLYLLPTDCLRLISVNGDNRLTTNYNIKGKYIYPKYAIYHFSSPDDDIVNALKLEYITNDYKYLENATSIFCRYCSYSLAKEIAPALNANNLNQIIDEIEYLRVRILSNEDIDNNTVIYKTARIR